MSMTFPLPLVGFQDLLAQANGLRRHFHELAVRINSTACSRFRRRGGTRRMASSEVEARMLVNFFP